MDEGHKRRPPSTESGVDGDGCDSEEGQILGVKSERRTSCPTPVIKEDKDVLRSLLIRLLTLYYGPSPLLNTPSL